MAALTPCRHSHESQQQLLARSVQRASHPPGPFFGVATGPWSAQGSHIGLRPPPKGSAHNRASGSRNAHRCFNRSPLAETPLFSSRACASARAPWDKELDRYGNF